MTKEWVCGQCGEVQTRSIISHVRNGPPEACENCGNDAFEERTFGPAHSMIDSVLS